MIPVTKSFIPPIDEYKAHVERAFDNGWLTNRGKLCLELESELKKYLNVSYINLMTNGTLPIQIALKTLGKQGEIITTPFSYVATTSTIVWENCTPVFVDIDPEFLTIDETKIEAAITENTTCILATHVFGNPCNTSEIERIAKKHGLSVIYDAAHCFGVDYLNQSLFNYGDISTASFHATKIFHTGEGGALFANNADIQHETYFRHNFGHKTPESFYDVGINAKISELQAAMGLAVLPHIDEIINERKNVVEYYRSSLNFESLKTIRIREHTKWNYSYFPVIFESEEELLRTLDNLKKHRVFPRRYFCPSLNTLEYVNAPKMEISESIASRVLCLPLYVGISDQDLKMIAATINESLRA
jgi:dTDP-4-amino-4,6-dideoxygalactose transaminase